MRLKVFICKFRNFNGIESKNSRMKANYNQLHKFQKLQEKKGKIVFLSRNVLFSSSNGICSINSA